eukprot:gene12243-biopygen1900
MYFKMCLGGAPDTARHAAARGSHAPGSGSHAAGRGPHAAAWRGQGVAWRGLRQLLTWVARAWRGHGAGMARACPVPPGRNGHARVRPASVCLKSIVRSASGPRSLPFSPGEN